MKRRWFWLSAAFVLLVLVAGLLFVPFDAPRISQAITEANCDRIKKGMTLRQVEAILGGPPGDYTAWPHPRDDVEHLGAPGGSGEHWTGEKGTIDVSFDENGKVSGTYFDPGADRARRLRDEWQRFLWRLKL
jgi:hypothetical protein